jgi:YHS domain-containing protein
MRHILLAAALLAACSRGSAPRQDAPVQQAAAIKTIENVDPRPVVHDPPPVLQDEAPPPKPKGMPWEPPQVVVLSPEDEKLRASLPFSPAIAMDPVDGSKISIRASTPTVEYKGKIYYFSNEANRRTFMSNPEQAIKGGFMKL